MKKFLPFVFMFVFITAAWNVSTAQSYHFKEGFGGTPDGWTLDNTYLTTSSSNVHNEFDGSKSVKMKGTESTVETAAYATAAELSYWILPMFESTTLKVEKSIDEGASWTELESFVPTAGEIATYQKRTITVDDESGSVKLKFTATGGADGEGIFYLDDVSLSKMEGGASVATLSEITVNGTPLVNFDEGVLNYSIELFYTDNVVVAATANNSEATLNITQVSDLFGDSLSRTVVLEVVSQDGTVTTNYTVTVKILEYIFKTGFIETGDGVDPGPGWEGGYNYTSENVPGPGDHAEFEGYAAFKFVRGQEDKAGYLKSPKYPKVKSLNFWMFVESPDPSAELKIEATTGDNTTELSTITAGQLSASEWTFFSFEVNQEDSTEFLLTPTLPTDGSTRLWMDDLHILTTADVTLTDARQIERSNINVYPNPVTDVLYIQTNETSLKTITLYNIAGQAVYQSESSNHTDLINMAEQKSGLYILKMEGDFGVRTQKIIKK